MKRPLRILIVEDSKDDADLLLWEVRSGGFDPSHVRVDTLDAMGAALDTREWDIVVSDYTMPQFSGLAAMRLVQERRLDLPVIIVSGNIGEEIAVEAMRAGASDYVMKNSLSRLVPAIERELRENEARRAGRAAQRELQENEARLRGLVSNIPGMVFQLVRAGESGYLFPYVSEGSLALLELTPRQLLDEPARFFNMLFLEGRATLEHDLLRSGREKVAVNWEGRIRTPASRTIKWLSLRLSPRIVDGSRVQWEGIMMNITRSKQAEIEINESRQRLSELSAHLQSAKEQERTKIAREVHDDIGGNLTAMKIDLLWLINRLGKAGPDMLDKARAIEALADRTMEITSRIARDLRPPLLELGLLAAIEWEAGEFQSRMEIPCIVNCAGEDIAVDPELASALFSIFRETLTNISKHARASAVHVHLGVGDGKVSLSVSDNGRGIQNTDLLKPGSFGLRGMLERGRNLGGDVSFKGAPGEGTTVTVRLPLEATGQPPAALTENATDAP